MKAKFFTGALAGALVLRLVTPFSLQLGAQEKEVTLEESYLQESVATQVIREQARSADREGKLLALDYIKEVMDTGGNAAELVPILQDLSLEGILNQTREEGRIVDNFPDVRIRAVEYLGSIGASAASNEEKVKISEMLTKTVNIDNEPAVMTSAVRSIIQVGIDCYPAESKGHALAVVNHNFVYLNIKQPDNRFALAYIEAIADITPRLSTGGQGATMEERLAYQNAIENLRKINENSKYIPTVRTRAKTVLSEIQKKAAGGK